MGEPKVNEAGRVIATVDEVVIMRCTCGYTKCECGFKLHFDHSKAHQEYRYCPACGRRVRNA